MNTVSAQTSWPMAPLSIPCMLPYRGLFTDDELSQINKLTSGLKLTESVTNGIDMSSGIPKPSRVHSDYREAKNAFIPASEESAWLFGKLSDAVAKVNREVFDFDINMIECLQYTEYDVGSYYKDHIDLGTIPPTSTRKISFVIQLSDETEYDGGELRLKISEHHFTFSKTKGDILFFPSFVLHEVTPVTRGLRKSLVGWVMGTRKFK